MKVTVTMLLFFVFSLALTGQDLVLSGRVVDATNGDPLPYASVYFNGTTNGTTTDLEGKFEITVNPLFTELVISFLSYETLSYKLGSEALNKTYLFEMAPNKNELAEVKISSKRGEKWHNNLLAFKRNFIGTSSLARQTKILNPEVLQFDYDSNNQTFYAKARGPLIIENEALGYKIEYALEGYSHSYADQKIIYFGYPKFIEMKGGKMKRKKWKRQREAAYHGSPQHFLKSIFNQTAEADGYMIQLLQRKPNPNRPPQEQIDRAKTFARDYVRQTGSFSLPDSIQNILTKSKESKFIDFLNTNRLNYARYVDIVSDSEAILSYDDHWQITYDKEKVDKYYLESNGPFTPATKPKAQVSIVSMTVNSTTINNLGITTDPLALLFEGYWSFEKIGDLMPLDYGVN